MSEKIIHYLPEDQELREKLLDELLAKYNGVTLKKDNQGRSIAEVRLPEETNERIHPVTGLPVLND